MRIVVTGAAGFIGFQLSRRLLDEGHRVVGVDNFVSGQPGNMQDLASDKNFEAVETDIADPLSVPGDVDIIFNMACPASPIDFRDKSIEIMRTCSQGVAHVLELAREKSAIFLQAST